MDGTAKVASKVRQSHSIQSMVPYSSLSSFLYIASSEMHIVLYVLALAVHAVLGRKVGHTAKLSAGHTCSTDFPT